MSDPKNYDGIVWLRGQKTLLCPLEEGDLPFFNRAINDPETQQFLIVNWPINSVGQRQWYDAVSSGTPNKITVAVRTLEGELIGNMAISFNEEKKTAVTGSLIGASHLRGQGYGTDAKMTLLNYAFTMRGMRKVTSNIIGYNKRSRRYARRCGYRFTARIPGEYFRHGKWRSEVIYTCWHDEWRPLYATHLAQHNTKPHE